MQNVIFSQLYIFLIYIVLGIVIGIIFDIFRILRKLFKTPDLITYLEDIIFWIIAGLLLIFVIFKFSSGEIRIYNIIGLVIGSIFYIIVISKYFININVKIILVLKNIVKKFIIILMYPIKIILRIIKGVFKPFTFFVINIRKILSNSKVKIKTNKKI